MGKFYINQTEEITGIRTTTFQVNASDYEEALQKLKREGEELFMDIHDLELKERMISLYIQSISK